MPLEPPIFQTHKGTLNYTLRPQLRQILNATLQTLQDPKPKSLSKNQTLSST